MNRHYFLIIVGIAIGCLLLIFISLWREIESPVTKEPSLIPPPKSPYKTYISGVGIVEPASENILIGTPINRLVDEVAVSIGEKVKKGQLLLRLENRDLEANLQAELALYKIALAKLQKLKSLPRGEDLIAAEASLKSIKGELDLAKKQNEMIELLPDPRAISQEEKNRRLFNFHQAEDKWMKAKADFEKIKSGAWQPDIEIAHLQVLEAKSNVERIQTEIARTLLKSPIDGTVLQIKIHPGEFPPPNTYMAPLMILGDTEQLHLRVSINQLDIPNFSHSAPATAFLQGDARISFPLEFVRVEPFLVNKQNLTNEVTERVDTRVLQLIYRIKNQDQRIFVGEQMDVFIESNHE